MTSTHLEPWNPFVLSMMQRLSPLYFTFATQSETDPEIRRLAELIGREQPMPVTFFAAVNALLFRDRDHPLSKYYPCLSSVSAAPQEAYPAFRDFCLSHVDELQVMLPTFRLQTNEVTRCANLLPVFEMVWQRGGRKPLALIEMGASAGLNLFWDHYCYEYGSIVVGNPASAVRVNCALEGEYLPPIPETMPEVGYRIGMDLFPLDMTREYDVRCLQGAIWPEEVSRYHLLSSAIAFFQGQPTPHMLQGNAAELLPDVLGSLVEQEDYTICLWHSYALRQGLSQDRERVERIIATHAQSQPLFQISLEIEQFLWKEPRLELFTYHNGRQVDHEWLATTEVHGTTMTWRQPTTSLTRLPIGTRDAV